MKQLKSTYQDLRDLFTSYINIRHILEPLKSCKARESAATAKRRMENKDFDAMGVEDKGKVEGYLEKMSLGTGLCRDYIVKFTPSDLVEESTSLVDIFSALRGSPRKFVADQTRVIGIVTRGDLQKAPVRMWLFGLITLLEMNLLRIVRSRYPADSWKACLSDRRIAVAKRLFDSRKKRNEAIDLADCLQFCDKRDLVLRIPEIKESIGKKHKGSAANLLRSVQRLRDKLCHAQDLIEDSTWPELIDLVKDLEWLLEFLEHCK